MYTFVRPEAKEEPELLVVGRRALQDVGLLEGEELTEEFKEMVAGNKIFWNPETEEGVYPWAQCYGGMFHEVDFSADEDRMAIVRRFH